LCAHAVSRLTRLGKRIRAVGLGSGGRLRDRRRSVGKRVRAISAARVRGRQALATLDRLTGEIADRAKQTAREARALARSARRDADGQGVSVALVERLERELVAAERILAQTDLRLAGQRTIPDRRVSLIDPDARPLRFAHPGRPTEFGYKARIGPATRRARAPLASAPQASCDQASHDERPSATVCSEVWKMTSSTPASPSDRLGAT
jgi:transposase, IS5 family